MAYSTTHCWQRPFLMNAARHTSPMQGRSGFSLVELSIVLVILGLLTGGILGGQSLIKAAELRSVGKEYEQWQTAVNTFREKYRTLPGDMANATDFWDTDTWDGNGDGIIDYGAAVSQEGEVFMFWQHLALAGLINGQFSGEAGAGSVEDSYVNVNVPSSKYSSGGWSVAYADEGETNPSDCFDLDYGNYYHFGSKIDDWEMGGELLTPEQAWNIDTKFDDGKPGKGNVIARYWDEACSIADTAGTEANDNFEASYNLSETSEQCALFFRNAI